MKICVLGTGSWGTALAKVLSDNHHAVIMWGRNHQIVEEIQGKHTNESYLPDGKIPSNVQATTDLALAVKDSDMVILVVPTKAIRSICQQIKPILAASQNKPYLVHASKGLEVGSKLRISQIIKQELADLNLPPVTVLSGPSHAEEVMVEDITTVTAANETLAIAELVQDTFTNDYFRVYSNIDVVGVELGGALKNIIAVASGILSGSGYGDNARAALITRGLAEITRLGTSLGADPLTFSGLSGVGDLFVTCNSTHSRNYRAGYLIGQGKSVDQVEAAVKMVVEGISTTKVAKELAEARQVEMPITQGMYRILYENIPVEEAVKALMARDKKQEAHLGQFE